MYFIYALFKIFSKDIDIIKNHLIELGKSITIKQQLKKVIIKIRFFQKVRLKTKINRLFNKKFFSVKKIFFES